MTGESQHSNNADACRPGSPLARGRTVRSRVSFRLCGHLFCRWHCPKFGRQDLVAEVARINLSGIDPLKIYVLISPLLVFGVALAFVWLTGWLDRREQQRHPAE